jgi:transposase
MAPYSMDLRKRVAKAWDAGVDADAVAAKDDVSRAWVHRLIQRRRETGSLAPRKQTKFRRRVLTVREEERLAALILARPDATLTELRDAVPTTAASARCGGPSIAWGLPSKKNGTRRRAAPA